MKQGSTLKLEVIHPVGMPWYAIKPRLFALRHTCAQALTMTMQEHHGDAAKELAAWWAGEEPDKRWRGSAYKTLGRCWELQMNRARERAGEEPKEDGPYVPVKTSITLETVDAILSRFNGDHLTDLRHSRASFPSFSDGGAFYASASAISISGSPDAARIRFPLWGQGRHATELAIAPAGGSARAQWRKLVADYERRDEVAALEGQLKTKGCAGEKRKAIISHLEKLGLTKVGKIGLKYDERRRKWYALVTYTAYASDTYAEGQKAAVNFGVNVFIQALAEDASEWHEDGDQILAKRIEWQSTRRRIQRSMRTFGSGSKGRGKKRREKPLTKRLGRESRFVQTYIRQLAAKLIAWCRQHRVSDLYLEDMHGIREQFERDTEGQAHAEVKRRIHNWPYYETAQAIERQGQEFGVRVHRKGARYVSQRCPDCRHVAPENVQEIVIPGIPLMHEGKMYRRIEKTSRFECRSCGKRGGSDFIACMNHLLDVGATFGGGATPLQKAQERAKVTVTKDKRRKIRRQDGKGNLEGNVRQRRHEHPPAAE